MNITQKIVAELRKAVQGKDQVLVWVLMTILANGNVLLEDIPGVGKTNMALAFSRALDLDYGRVQFKTPITIVSNHKYRFVVGLQADKAISGVNIVDNGATIDLGEVNLVKQQ